MPRTKKSEPARGSRRKEPVKSPAEILFQGQRVAKKRRTVATLEQWIEVEISSDGQTTTTLYPSNEQLIVDGQKMWPAPEMVYRRIFFVNGVPPEYAWTEPSDDVRERGGLGIQRMTIERWLDLIKEEKARGAGHVGPCGGNVPRPEERGGCECPVCERNRALLEKLTA